MTVRLKVRLQTLAARARKSHLPERRHCGTGNAGPFEEV
jgi:hypothetical protein